jgi:ornithine--oxo-acid transaminase
MSPIALTEESSSDKRNPRYHVESSEAAFKAEAEYAAHNYHPLEVVFARAKGVEVWDPVSFASKLLQTRF